MSATRSSILLVEDHGVMGRMLARLLREQGKMGVWAVAGTAEAALYLSEAVRQVWDS